jgi:hypothetical protein
MPAIIASLLDAAYRWPERRLILVNVGLACFVGLSHVGALLLSHTQSVPDAASMRMTVTFSLPLVLFVIVTAFAVLMRRSALNFALRVHSYILGFSALWLLAWAIQILITGIPDNNFVWTVGLMSAWVFYSAVLLVRFALPETLRSHQVAYYFPVLALVVALFFDIGVLMLALP